MEWKEIIKGRVVFCTPVTPISSLHNALGKEDGPVFVIKEGKITGVIKNFRALVQEYTSENSPFPVGQLLKNVVRELLFVSGGNEIEESQKRKDSWLELWSQSSGVIAWFSMDEAKQLVA